MQRNRAPPIINERMNDGREFRGMLNDREPVDVRIRVFSCRRRARYARLEREKLESRIEILI